MTVEMSLVFPIVIYVVASIVYAGLYMHDRLTIQSVINQQALSSSIAAKYPVNKDGHILYENINDRGIFFQINSDYSKEETIETSMAKNHLEDQLYITKISSVHIAISYTKITIDTSCNVNIPFTVVRKLLGKDKMNYKESIDIDVFRPAEFVRIFTVFSEVIEGTKIGDEVLSKLHKVLEGGS